MSSSLDCCTPWTVTCQAPLSSTISRSLFKFTSIELVMLPNHLILCLPLLLLPSVFPRSKIFSNKLALHISWPKYWSFSFSISPSKEYSGLISFRIDWFYLHYNPREGQRRSLVITGQWGHQSCLCNEASLKTQRTCFREFLGIYGVR